jgi:hypothetical protein
MSDVATKQTKNPKRRNVEKRSEKSQWSAGSLQSGWRKTEVVRMRLNDPGGDIVVLAELDQPIDFLRLIERDV